MNCNGGNRIAWFRIPHSKFPQKAGAEKKSGTEKSGDTHI